MGGILLPVTHEANVNEGLAYERIILQPACFSANICGVNKYFKISHIQFCRIRKKKNHSVSQRQPNGLKVLGFPNLISGPIKVFNLCVDNDDQKTQPKCQVWGGY